MFLWILVSSLVDYSPRNSQTLFSPSLFKNTGFFFGKPGVFIAPILLCFRYFPLSSMPYTEITCKTWMVMHVFPVITPYYTNLKLPHKSRTTTSPATCKYKRSRWDDGRLKGKGKRKAGLGAGRVWLEAEQGKTLPHFHAPPSFIIVSFCFSLPPPLPHHYWISHLQRSWLLPTATWIYAQKTCKCEFGHTVPVNMYLVSSEYRFKLLKFENSPKI